MNKTRKRIISFIAVCVLCFNFMITSVFSEVALAALGITAVSAAVGLASGLFVDGVEDAIKAYERYTLQFNESPIYYNVSTAHFYNYLDENDDNYDSLKALTNALNRYVDEEGGNGWALCQGLAPSDLATCGVLTTLYAEELENYGYETCVTSPTTVLKHEIDNVSGIGIYSDEAGNVYLGRGILHRTENAFDENGFAWNRFGTLGTWNGDRTASHTFNHYLTPSETQAIWFMYDDTFYFYDTSTIGSFDDGVKFTDIYVADDGNIWFTTTNKTDVTSSTIYNGRFYLKEAVDLNGNKLQLDDWSVLAGCEYGFVSSDSLTSTMGELLQQTYSDGATVLPDNGTTEEEKIYAVPVSGELQTIIDGINGGIIDGNSNITFNDDGTIKDIDGMTLEKLQEILDVLNGSLQFSDVQGYLEYITAALQADAITQRAANKILERIENTLTGPTIIDVPGLDVPNTEIVAPEIGDIVIDWDIPFAESMQVFYDRVPVLGQATELLGNLFNTDYSEGAPDFRFYFDSNGDGVDEIYNFLDLSFLDEPLTNENLSDKSLISDVWTFRKFLHAAIILFVYVHFFIKLVREIPALVHGSTAAYDSYTEHKARMDREQFFNSLRGG